MTEPTYYWLFFLLCLLTGMCAGSFMNVVIYRLPLMIFGTGDGDERFSLAWPPSHCPVCHHRIRFYDNIPVMSWLVLRGKCRRCRTRISAVYPLTEAITGLWFAVVYLCLAGPVNTLLTISGAAALLPPLALFCLLYCITVTDVRHYLIPDVLSLGLLWSGLVLSVCGLIRVSPFQAVTGCVLAYCLISAVQYGYRVIRGHEGLGGGDAKLFAAASVWVGLSQVPWLILFSAVCGGVLFGIKKFYQRKILVQAPAVLPGEDNDDSEGLCDGFYIPFGPAIALATLVLFFTRI
ncbi:prepilin peptidase [Salmonella enterica]|nr:A24 family peptidase [Salmonella enterica]EAB9790760.1 prepilin peptidase [Salmonella enterica subsp. enterica serovar Muenchen]EAV3187794.1 prepilin peptidase [Salmonella enterica subsp. enterica]ECC3883988.1 prepilin peptidase [Salmonella enterica subsp. diarizonae]ECT8868065.1 prepilin peptidase [Salmonella enterica subsp. enterica serovar Pensacola]ECT9718777.1 prepilin peptidase [Salmonella enterica subsp. diarizonae str. CFSAN000553]EGE4754017.1 prepilin peptidase [Salmonella enteric